MTKAMRRHVIVPVNRDGTGINAILSAGSNPARVNQVDTPRSRCSVLLSSARADRLTIAILRGVFLFPKSVSGTSDKSRKNKGDDMTETSDDELRQRFFELVLSNASQNEIVWWSQNRVRELEQHAKDIGEVLEQREKGAAQMQSHFAQMQSHLGDRNETIDKLEAEIERLTNQLSSNSTNLESDEDQHQRHRRERMLDEVTLVLVQVQIAELTESVAAERTLGKLSRETAVNICSGIHEYDAKH